MATSKVEYAVQWACAIANDDSHGYDQGSRWGPDYDCSSLIISAYEEAGVPVKSAGANTTHDMVPAFKKCGFVEVANWNRSTGSGLIRGDVLVRVSGHTEMCIGNGQLVKASQNEFGGARGGTIGDQTGKEVKIGGYYDGGWDYALRYPNTEYTDKSIGSANTSSKLYKFIQCAKEQIGKKQDWVKQTINCGDIEWCAAFVCACAKVADILDICIPHSYSCTYMTSTGVSKNMGTFHKGPFNGCTFTPQVGDLVMFRWESNYSTEYESDHVGIVIDCDGAKFHTIEGNTGTWDRHTSCIKQKEYDVTYKCINGYFRPDWSLVGASVNDMLLGGFVGGTAFSLYNTENTREDAMIREIGYLDSDYKPSISTSKIKLSVINYTSRLAEIFSQFSVASYGGSGTVIVDGIENPTAKAIIEYLIDKGLNAAGAIGICANIKHESGYRTDVIEYGYTFANGGAGLCQWTNYPRSAATGRKTDMVAFVGDDWKTDLTGQLDFLWYELNSSYYLSRVLEPIRLVPNTEEGARSAADTFVRKFEVPANIDAASQTRQSSASELWSQCIVQQVQVGGGIATQITTQSGKTPTNPVTHDIPSWVNQSGITQNYTNYSYFYGRWANSSIQKQLAEIWNQQGKPSDRNIATISGYYCIAITLTLGTTGDIVTVILEDGTSFNCIVADSKGHNPALNGESGNQYGHAFGNSTIDVIEWEKKGSSASNVDNHTQIDLTGWKGKRVSRIINHGPYLI